MIRVLHINAQSRIFGGVSAFCLNIYRNIDRSRVQFDFLTPNITTYGEFRDEIEGYGGHLYDLGINSSNTIGKIKLMRALKGFLKEHRYDIITVNSGVLSFNCAVASACRRYSDAVIFVHSHSNGGRSSAKETFSEPLKRYLVKQADQLLACSDSAARYMFPDSRIKDTVVINNGIIVDNFRYDPGVRERLRRDLGLSDKFVIGHVGRFTREKNHGFLIEVLKSALAINDRAVLMLVGEGPLLDDAKKKAKELGVEERVMFLGSRSDVRDLYQVMDVFALPSLFEGFGIVNIEAQTSGLKCVTSTAVPAAVDVTGNVSRLSLDAPKDEWARELLSVPELRRNYSDVIKEKGFDMALSAEKLEKMYEQCMRRTGK